MAPQTNIGSSTPIDSGGSNIGSDLRRKLINHEAASLRALAQSHGRNVRWADRAVRRGHQRNGGRSAAKLNVIEAIAPTLPSLLEQSDGVKTKPKRLHAPPRRRTDSQRSPRLLHAAAEHADRSEHPSAALPRGPRRDRLRDLPSRSRARRARSARSRSSPHSFGSRSCPISWGGVLLILLGVALLVVRRARADTRRADVAGLVSVAVGSIMLFQNAPGYHTSKPLVIGSRGRPGRRSGRSRSARPFRSGTGPVEVGPQLIAGSVGEVRGGGLVYVNGELWQARTSGGEELRLGSRCGSNRSTGS